MCVYARERHTYRERETPRDREAERDEVCVPTLCLSKESYFAAKEPCICVKGTYVPTEGRKSCMS